MTRKLKVFIRRLKAMSFKRMFALIDVICKENKASKIRVFFDMIWCAVRYGVGYLDYKVFGFAVIRGKKRRSFMTMNHNLAIVRRFNDKEYFKYLDDKLEFNKKFKDFIGRDWIDLRESKKDGFIEFCQGKTAVFAKACGTFGGQGIGKLEIGSASLDSVYDELLEQKRYLVEDMIIQHPEMSRLSPTSVNTVRMVTLMADGKPQLMYSLVRMGNGKNEVDNISSGGLYTGLDENGVAHHPAFCDKTGLYYDEHPVTGVKFDGFTIPDFARAKEMVLKAAACIEQMRYVGWDVAFTPEGPILVEGNNFPSYDMAQNYRHIENKTGLLPRFEAVLGSKIK